MHDPNRSCCGATQVGCNVKLRATEKRMTRTTQKRRRRTQRRRRRSEKRACNGTIEESSSVDEVDAWRKRPRYYKESPCFRLTHLRSDTFLHLHTTTLRVHGRCSNEMWFHELASVHFTIAASGSNLGLLMISASPRLRSLR